MSTNRTVRRRPPKLAALFGVLAALAAVLIAPAGLAQPVTEPDAKPNPHASLPRTISEWNLQIAGRQRVALKGYDPVAYFPEGGGKAERGLQNLNVNYRGLTYYFTTIENRDRFAKNPNRYEPAYGGWCAWAMSKGDKTNIDPKSFIVRGDRLFVFYKGLFGDTRKDWLRGNHENLSRRADASWQRMAGEGPRRFPILPDEPEETENDSDADDGEDAANDEEAGTGPVVEPTPGG